MPDLDFTQFKAFWAVVREGGLAAAAHRLQLDTETVDARIAAFEAYLGEPLFRRSASWELSEAGRLAYDYADEIFALGDAFEDAFRARPAGDQPLRVVVGATPSLPKLVVRRMLEPAFETRGARLVCLEDEHGVLLRALQAHEVDVVLSDRPVGLDAGVHAYDHLLGTSGVTFFATPALAATLDGAFPENLDGAPLLAPLPSSALGRSLAQWLRDHGLEVEVAAEIQDSALIKALGAEGRGVFCLPSAIEAHVRDHYDVQVLGRTRDVETQFYAISVDRRLTNPAVSAICEAARAQLSGLEDQGG